MKVSKAVNLFLDYHKMDSPRKNTIRADGITIDIAPALIIVHS